MDGKGVVAIVIFVAVYGLILAGEKSPRGLDRTAAGLIGGVFMVGAGVLTRGQALAAIDFATLALLLGMMLVIHYATESGLLDTLAIGLVGRSRGPVQLLWLVGLAAGILSALFVNDTICLLMTPLVLTACRRARLPAEPYLIALATSSNVGSVMTLTGNPQNMLIGQSSAWTWGGFALRMMPLGLVCLAINGAVVALLYRKSLQAASFDGDHRIEGAVPLDHRLATKTLVVLAGLLVAFLGGVPLDVAALGAGVALLLLANRPAGETFASVDWSLLLFFAGLFVVVEGITRTQGRWLTLLVPALTRHPGSLSQLAGFSFASVAGSNVFSNVPFVMLLRSSIVHLPHAPLLWLALAASSTLAGNLTLVGSVANLIVAQKAKNECPLGFWVFLRVGVLTTGLTVLASVFILWLYGRLGWI